MLSLFHVTVFVIVKKRRNIGAQSVDLFTIWKRNSIIDQSGMQHAECIYYFIQKQKFEFYTHAYFLNKWPIGTVKTNI